MSLKNRLIEAGVYVYIAGCLAAGIFTGKFLYDLLHASHQPFSWLKAGLAVYVGALVTGVWGIPTHRYALPECPECESGRLHKKAEILDEYEGWANMKLYYGMRGIQEFVDKRDTTMCDRCDYKSVREYTVEGNITIH